ncbi:hypothetical protein HO133_007748 [Letharia lupina]|nr:uncharacterized protein HO133_007748 [Letharia lupina]KAF6228020.1 hypothetical protein HO133_007748 [Letharia lupina]
MARPCRLRAPSHMRISTIKQQVRSPEPLLRVPIHRQFSQTLSFALPRKDSQDKDSINTEATEYSKSATDDEGARQEDAAFDPDITDPQEQKDKAGEGTGKGTDTNNPLDVSPANPEVSKQRGETEGGAENSSSSSDTKSDRKRSSGGSSPSKGSKVA